MSIFLISAHVIIRLITIWQIIQVQHMCYLKCIPIRYRCQFSILVYKFGSCLLGHTIQIILYTWQFWFDTNLAHVPILAPHANYLEHLKISLLISFHNFCT